MVRGVTHQNVGATSVALGLPRSVHARSAANAAPTGRRESAQTQRILLPRRILPAVERGKRIWMIGGLFGR